MVDTLDWVKFFFPWKLLGQFVCNVKAHPIDLAAVWG
jgi:hypothetical protein